MGSIKLQSHFNFIYKRTSSVQPGELYWKN